MVLFAVILGIAGSGIWFACQSWGRPRLNIVIVTLDTTRADHLGCYGYERAMTPTIDELASRGILFEKAYAPAPLTLPSHATMFTGLQPVEHGVMTNGRGRLGSDVTTFSEIAREKGFVTAAFVASFVLNAKFGLNQGIDTYDDDLSGTPRPTDALHRERSGNIVVDSALNWLTHHKNERFHCWIHLYDPHKPYLPHEDLFGDQFQEHPYDAEIAFVDLQLARVLKFLNENKLDRNTLVVVVGDHGEGLGEHNEPTHGYQLYDSTLHVPLIIVPPDSTTRGLRITEPVSLVDLFPTLLELLQFPIPKGITGRSLAPAIQGNSIDSRPCFAMSDEPFLDNGWSPLRSLITSEWKYIRSPKPELYNREHDLSELSNRAAENPDVVEELEYQLSELEKKMHGRKPVEANLSAKEKRALESLGYTGGIASPTAAKGAPGIDVKEMLPLANRLADAMEMVEHGRAGEAEPILREIVHKKPDYRKALGNLGICLAGLGQLDEAIECYHRVLQIDPSDTNALLNLGAALASQGKILEAIDPYRKAMEYDATSAIAPLRLGQLYQDAGELEQALRLFAEAIARDPEADDAYRALGDLEAASGHLKLAIKHYETALKLNPNSIPTLVNYGIIEARSRNLEAAQGLFERAIAVNPQEILARQNLAHTFELRGERARAISEYEALLRKAPEHLPALIALGWIYAADPQDTVRNGARARELAERACQISNDKSVAALDLLAAAHAELGHFDEADQVITQALTLNQQGSKRPSSQDLKLRRDMYGKHVPFRTQARR
jgi:arylsulfatase A-like enzyme/Tfp pilus assembly protein PilF